ncbi:hypothetical protein CEP52_015083 [Fusarium oligoseptatum]|uniref:Uncharacterized protein n=1 Tax=Fusarium oligoseptatum TaxID=2604345 RepID=A0A428SGE3_9HYPO|nr:hypothetical protein CEP52_015083 [Fusarium oligoseptatum]
MESRTTAHSERSVAHIGVENIVCEASQLASATDNSRAAESGAAMTAELKLMLGSLASQLACLDVYIPGSPCSWSLDSRPSFNLVV